MYERHGSHTKEKGIRCNLLSFERGLMVPVKLVYYTGNYSTYVKTKVENETNQMKAYNKQQEEIAHIKKSCFFTFALEFEKLNESTGL